MKSVVVMFMASAVARATLMMTPETHHCTTRIETEMLPFVNRTATAPLQSQIILFHTLRHPTYSQGINRSSLNNNNNNNNNNELTTFNPTILKIVRVTNPAPKIISQTSNPCDEFTGKVLPFNVSMYLTRSHKIGNCIVEIDLYR